MIVEIHRSSPSMAGTLRYNGDKVRSGLATVLCEKGIGSTDLGEISRVFADRERLSLRGAEHMSFQMSVNPGKEDCIPEERIPELVRDLMEGLGYGEQPWVVYRHGDTGRIHYHVVSIRVDGDGRKIRDWYEKRACDRLVESLESRYGFRKGGGGAREREDPPVPVFRPGEGDTVGRIEAAVRAALSYRFTTGRQFAEVLRCHGVQVREGLDRNDLSARLSFQGLGQDGRPCTGSVSGRRLGFDVREELGRRMEQGAAQDVSAEKKALREDLGKALEKCSGLPSLTAELRTVGVDLIIYRDAAGTARGATLIDHRSRCVFKGSELSRTLGAALLGLDGAGSTPGDSPPTESPAGERESQEAIPGGVSEALSMLLAVTLTGGSGSRGGDGEEDEKKKINKRKRH